MLAGEITNKKSAWGYIFVFPAYLYYIPTITTFVIYQIMLFNPLLIDVNFATVMLNFSIGLLTTLLLFVLLKDFIIDNIKSFFLKPFSNLVWSCTLGISLMYAMSLLGSLIIVLVLGTDAVETGSSNQQLFEALQSVGPIFMFLQAVIFAPILEELLFRGIIFRSLSNRNIYLAHFISAFSFGLVHVYSYLVAGDLTQLIYMVMYILMGLALSIAYQKKGTIIVPIIIHLLNNGIAFIVSYM
ncbi:CPBP family intramembrane glutamic endopeptidase [Tannockella kyphosi]|uniref:CPBP family intramembrane glutamic endopeptidase n=1 Tax=Tannockella kyphosi TaxID=2899121 RepID=UPI002013781F|nr:CPBP family intramembrane glutamic endopeptidase [Tannockella kyphosi]